MMIRDKEEEKLKKISISFHAHQRQQFLWGTFESSYHPTSKKETYFPSVVLHDRNYPLKIVDIPDIPFVPPNSFYNISDLQGKNTIFRVIINTMTSIALFSLSRRPSHFHTAIERNTYLYN